MYTPHTVAIHLTTYHRGHDHTLPYCSHNAQESNNDDTKSNSHEKCTAKQISALRECCVLILCGVNPYPNCHRYHTHCLQIMYTHVKYKTCNCITLLQVSICRIFPFVQYALCGILYWTVMLVHSLSTHYKSVHWEKCLTCVQVIPTVYCYSNTYEERKPILSGHRLCEDEQTRERISYAPLLHCNLYPMWR